MAKKKKSIIVSSVVAEMPACVVESVEKMDLSQEINKINERIDRIVSAIDKSKSVRGL